MRDSAGPTKSDRETVVIRPLGDVEVLDAPLPSPLMGGIEDVEPISLDRTPAIQNRDDLAIGVAGDADEGTESKPSSISRHHMPIVGLHRIAAGRDPVGMAAAGSLIGAVGGHSHAERPDRHDRPTIEVT